MASTEAGADMTEETLKPVAWRYEIKHGPDGEANYAWLYRGDEMVATMRTHHAVYLASVPSAIAEKDKRVAELRDGMEDLGSKYLQAKFEAARLRALLAEAREVKSLVPTQRVDQIVGTADPTEDEAHDMAVELMNWRRAAIALAEKLEKEIGNE